MPWTLNWSAIGSSGVVLGGVNPRTACGSGGGVGHCVPLANTVDLRENALLACHHDCHLQAIPLVCGNCRPHLCGLINCSAKHNSYENPIFDSCGVGPR